MLKHLMMPCDYNSQLTAICCAVPQVISQYSNERSLPWSTVPQSRVAMIVSQQGLQELPVNVLRLDLGAIWMRQSSLGCT